MRLTYFGLFQSVAAYGIAFWGGSHDANQIFLLQKRAVRYICGVTQRTSCRPYFKQLRLLTFPCLYMYALIMHIRISGYDIKRQHFHSYNTRAKESLQLPFERLSVAQDNPRYMGTKLLNHLQYLDKKLTDIIPVHRFKKNLKQFLTERGYYSVDEFLSDRVR